MTRSDYLWLLVSMGVLSVAVLLQSRAIARLQEDMAFTKLAASAAFTQEMKP